MSARTKAYLLLVSVAAAWGIATPIIKVAFADFPPVIFLTYRFLITSVVTIPLLLILEPATWHFLDGLSAKEWSWLLLGGFLGSTLQLGLLFWGLSLTTSLDASLIGSTSPILVALAGHYILKEKIPFLTRIGLMIAFIGSVFTVIQPVFSGHKIFSGSILGNSLVFFGVISWVIYILLTKKALQHKISPLALMTIMFFVGFITMTFVAFFLYRPSFILKVFNHASAFGHLSVFYMSFISGAFAYWAYQKAQKTITASKADIFLYLSPLFTIPLAYFWLRESITLTYIIGCAVIAVGVVVSQFRR